MENPIMLRIFYYSILYTFYLRKM